MMMKSWGAWREGLASAKHDGPYLDTNTKTMAKNILDFWKSYCIFMSLFVVFNARTSVVGTRCSSYAVPIPTYSRTRRFRCTHVQIYLASLLTDSDPTASLSRKKLPHSPGSAFNKWALSRAPEREGRTKNICGGDGERRGRRLMTMMRMIIIALNILLCK